MTLRELIEKIAQTTDSAGLLQTILAVLQENETQRLVLESEVSGAVIEFITAALQGQAISPELLEHFQQEWATTSPPLQEVLSLLLLYVRDSVYNKHQDIIGALTKQLDSKSALIAFNASADPRPYQDLLNAYLIHQLNLPLPQSFLAALWGYRQQTPGSMALFYFMQSPQMTEKVTIGKTNEAIERKLPLAINVLRLAGQLPNAGRYHMLDFSEPCYPRHYDLLPTLAGSRGIKDKSDYYPYKWAHKPSADAGSATGDNTYVALRKDGKKRLFVRGKADLDPKDEHVFKPYSVLASKIARIIDYGRPENERHFSSERTLTNQLSASRVVPDFVVALSDRNEAILAKRRELTARGHVFPGTGTIHEVLNFVRESDDNLENFAYSSTDLEQAHLRKIDFDRCWVGRKTNKSDYDNGLYSHISMYGRYAGQAERSALFIQEKLTTRLKLTLIPPELFRALQARRYLVKIFGLLSKNPLANATTI